MAESETASRRIDVLAIGLFGLAVGALTVGMAQIGQIPEVDRVGVLVIALVFGGLVQVLAGVADIRYNEQLEGTALTMYGFFWFTVPLAQLVSMGTTFHFDSALYVFFSAVMVYLTAYRSVALSLLHAVITPDIFLHRLHEAEPDIGNASWDSSSDGWNPRFLSRDWQSITGLYWQGDCATWPADAPSSGTKEYAG